MCLVPMLLLHSQKMTESEVDFKVEEGGEKEDMVVESINRGVKVIVEKVNRFGVGKRIREQ